MQDFVVTGRPVYPDVAAYDVFKKAPFVLKIIIDNNGLLN